MLRCRLDETSFASTVYDAETYDDLPTYTWNESLDLDSFVREIDLGNDRLFGCLRTAICEKLGIDFRLQGCKVQRRLLVLKS